MKKFKKNFLAFVGALTFCGISFLLPHQSIAALVSAGETATFEFDLGSADLSSIDYLSYWVNGSASRFFGTLSLYDDLNAAPVHTESLTDISGDAYLGTYSTTVIKPTYPGLFDDPISYLTLDIIALRDSEFNFLSQADFSPFLRYGSFGGNPTTVDGVLVSQAAPVPEPATMLLFGTGLAWLAGTRLRKKKSA